MTEVAGELQSKFGPVSRSYFVAKRVVATQHRQGNLNENSISGYARSHKFEEVTIGLSLLCSLPVDVIERALVDRNREMLLVLAKALEFSWATTMALLFLGAKDHRITAQELKDLEREFGRLNVKTSRSVLEFYQSRKNAEGVADSDVPAPARACHAVRRPIGTGWGISTMNAISFGAQAAPATLPMSRSRTSRWMRPGSFSKPPTICGDARHRRSLPAGDRCGPERGACRRLRPAHRQRIFQVNCRTIRFFRSADVAANLSA